MCGMLELIGFISLLRVVVMRVSGLSWKLRCVRLLMCGKLSMMWMVDVGLLELVGCFDKWVLGVVDDVDV